MPFQKLILSLAFLLGGFAVGWIAERLVLRRLIDIALRREGERSDVFLTSLRGAITLWFTLFGIFAATLIAPLDERTSGIIVGFLRINFVLSLAMVFFRIGSGLLEVYTQRRDSIFASTTIFTNLARLLIILIGALFVLQGLGIAITPLLTTLGVGGIAVALALQDTLTNLFAGVYIIASKKIRIGDFIKLDSGDEGYVTDINWHNATIRTLANNMVIVPNSLLSSSLITNYQLPEGEMSVLVPVGVSYDSDLDLVEEVSLAVARDVLREVAGGVAEFEPQLRYNAFADYSIKFNVVLRARQATDQHLLRHTFIKRLHERYGREGIEIPFPVRTIYTRETSNHHQGEVLR